MKKEKSLQQRIVFVDDGYEKTMSSENVQDFACCLPLGKRVVEPAEDLGVKIKGNKYDKMHKMKLYRCSEARGRYRVIELKPAPIYQSDLRTTVSITRRL